MNPLSKSYAAPIDNPPPVIPAVTLPQSSSVLDGPPYTQAVVNSRLPSVLSPTKAVAPPRGKVYETPSTVRISPALVDALVVAGPLKSNSASGLVHAPLPASIEISSESSPVKLVFKSIWKP